MADIEAPQHNKPLADNVKRTVAVSALRKIHGLVRDDQNDERLERKALWIAAAVVGTIVLAVALLALSNRVKSSQDAGSFEGYAQRAAQHIERQIASVAKPGKVPVQSITYSVVIQSNGAIQSVRIMRPSGDNELDAKAVAAIKAAAPFEPFPETLRSKAAVFDLVRVVKL